MNAYVAQRIADRVWTDFDGKKYVREPCVLRVGHHGLRAKDELYQFIPEYGVHYITGAIHAGVGIQNFRGIPVKIAVLELGPPQRELCVLWSGSVGDVLDSSAMRSSGHPLCYSATDGVMVREGQGIVVVIEHWEDAPNAPAFDVDIQLRCFKLTPVDG